MIPFLTVGLVTLLAGWIMSHIIARRNLLNLVWSSNLNIFRIKSRVRRYFVLRGWSVRPFHYPDFCFIVRNAGAEIAVGCWPSHYDLLKTYVNDFGVIRGRLGFENKAVIMVTAEQATAEITDHAKLAGVYVIHYKHLQRLTAIYPASAKQIHEFLNQVTSSSS